MPTDPTPRKIIIDTDPGIDDAMAILYALSDPALELIGLTTVFGNVPVETATRNALALLELADSTLPVAEGAPVPRIQPAKPHPDFVHGVGGLGEVAMPQPARPADPRQAAEFLADTIRAHPGEVTLIPVGPLTNLAAALDLAPEIAGQVAEVIVMGGAVHTSGNVSKWAEANIWQDPHAAEVVFAAGWPVRLIGLDVTEQVRCVPDDFARLAAARPVVGGFLARAVRFYMDFHQQSAGFDGCYMHDPTAVIAAVRPDLFTFSPTPLRIVCGGEEIGATRPDPSGPTPPVNVAIAVEMEAVRQRFLDVIASGPLR